MFKRLIASLVCFTFILSNIQYIHAQDFSVNQLPVPGTMVGVSAPFSPLSLKGLVVDPQKPLEFQFIVDTGLGPQDTATIKDQANQLVKYFLAGLTIPEGDLWVNLSPYEKDRMVPAALGQTDLGRDLLAQDYILKQLTASLIYPEKDLGKEFWSKVYAKAQEQFGTTNVPVNTFNKVWILPDQAQVYVNVNAAYITQSTLKVMLDEDYMALHKHGAMASPSSGTHTLASQIVRAIILPEIEKEVNTGKNFATLRQMYQALILAKWYKETIQNGLLDALYTNKNKVAGVNLADPAIKEQIYERYLKAYKKGAFNYIKEDPTPDGQVVPRKYFSGGLELVPKTLKEDGKRATIFTKGWAMGGLLAVTLGLASVGNLASAQSINTPFQSQQTSSIQMQIAQAEASQEIALFTQRSQRTVNMYQGLGLSTLLLPLNLRPTIDSAEISNTMRWIGSHPMLTAGMTKEDMAMEADVLQVITSPLFLAVGFISFVFNIGMFAMILHETGKENIKSKIRSTAFISVITNLIFFACFVYKIDINDLVHSKGFWAVEGGLFAGVAAFLMGAGMRFKDTAVSQIPKKDAVMPISISHRILQLLKSLDEKATEFTARTFYFSRLYKTLTMEQIVKLSRTVAKDIESRDNKIEAFMALKRIYDVKLDKIATNVNNEDERIRKAAMDAIDNKLKTDSWMQYQVGFAGLKSNYPDVEKWAIELLTKSGKREAIKWVVNSLGNVNQGVRQTARESLKELGVEQSIRERETADPVFQKLRSLMPGNVVDSDLWVRQLYSEAKRYIEERKDFTLSYVPARKAHNRTLYLVQYLEGLSYDSGGFQTTDTSVGLLGEVIGSQIVSSDSESVVIELAHNEGPNPLDNAMLQTREKHPDDRMHIYTGKVMPTEDALITVGGRAYPDGVIVVGDNQMQPGWFPNQTFINAQGFSEEEITRELGKVALSSTQQTDSGAKIVADFSDTIAEPLEGKFLPFETELGKIVAQDLPVGERAAFLAKVNQAYDDFMAKRKDTSIPYNQKFEIWLAPYAGKLTQRHVEQLVASFRLSDNFLKTADLIKQTLGVATLDMDIASGTLANIIEAFLRRPDVEGELKEHGIRILKVRAARAEESDAAMMVREVKSSKILEGVDNLVNDTLEQDLLEEGEVKAVLRINYEQIDITSTQVTSEGVGHSLVIRDSLGIKVKEVLKKYNLPDNDLFKIYFIGQRLIIAHSSSPRWQDIKALSESSEGNNSRSGEDNKSVFSISHDHAILQKPTPDTAMLADELIQKLSKGATAQIRLEAAKAIAESRIQEGMRPLIQALDDPSLEVRLASLEALQSMFVVDHRPTVHWQSFLEPAMAVPLLAKLERLSETLNVRSPIPQENVSRDMELHAYLNTIAYFHESQVADFLINYLEKNKDRMQTYSLGILIETLGKVGDPRAVNHLIPFLEHPDVKVRRLTIIALGNLGDPAGLAPLNALGERLNNGELEGKDNTTLELLTFAKMKIETFALSQSPGKELDTSMLGWLFSKPGGAPTTFDGFVLGDVSERVILMSRTLQQEPALWQAIAAVNFIGAHPSANPGAMKTLRTVAASYPDHIVQVFAKECLVNISRLHKDPVVRQRASDYLKNLDENDTAMLQTPGKESDTAMLGLYWITFRYDDSDKWKVKLERYLGKQNFETLVRLLDNYDFPLYAREMMVKVLANNYGNRAIEPLTKYSSEHILGPTVLKTIEMLGADKGILFKKYSEIASHNSFDDEVIEAIEWLSRTSHKEEAISVIRKASKFDSSKVRRAARKALEALGVGKEILYQAYIDELHFEFRTSIETGYSRQPPATVEALEWLGNSGRQEAVEQIIQKLEDSRENIMHENYESSVRRAARKALEALGVDHKTLVEANIRAVFPKNRDLSWFHSKGVQEAREWLINTGLKDTHDPVLRDNIIEALKKSGVDVAMLKAPGQEVKPVLEENGGIDLNQIDIKRTGNTFKVQFDQAQLNQLRQGGFAGFSPVIINIKPIASPFELLGVGPAKENELLAKA